MSKWQDIETAPLNTVVDLWAKSWDAETDTFKGKRFHDYCKKIYDTTWFSQVRPDGGRSRIPDDWRPTHWMVSEPPKEWSGVQMNSQKERKVPETAPKAQQPDTSFTEKA